MCLRNGMGPKRYGILFHTHNGLGRTGALARSLVFLGFLLQMALPRAHGTYKSTTIWWWWCSCFAVAVVAVAFFGPKIFCTHKHSPRSTYIVVYTRRSIYNLHKMCVHSTNGLLVPYERFGILGCLMDFISYFRFCVCAVQTAHNTHALTFRCVFCFYAKTKPKYWTWRKLPFPV